MAGQKRHLHMCDGQIQPDVRKKRQCLSHGVFNQHDTGNCTGNVWSATDSAGMECESLSDNYKDNNEMSVEDFQNGFDPRVSERLRSSHREHNGSGFHAADQGRCAQNGYNLHGPHYDFHNGVGLHPGSNAYNGHNLQPGSDRCMGHSQNVLLDENGYILGVGTTNNNHNSGMSVCLRCQAGEPGHIGHIGR